MKLTQEKLRKRLEYNRITGEMIWRYRPRSDFKFDHTHEHFNTKFAGKPAGSIAGHGYLRVVLFSKEYLIHRLIWLYMTGDWPNQIDHINHIKTDNRWVNLRNATQHQNNKNRGLSNNNTSGIQGVGWHAPTNKWRAYIRHNNEYIHLGLFNDKFKAINARLRAEKKYGFHDNHGLPKQDEQTYFSVMHQDFALVYSVN